MALQIDCPLTVLVIQMSKISNENLIAQASIETVPSATQDLSQLKVLGVSLGSWIFIMAVLLTVCAGLITVVNYMCVHPLPRSLEAFY